jgi:hypothetical protein
MHQRKSPEEEEAAKKERARKRKAIIKVKDVNERLETCPGDKWFKLKT